MGLRPKKTAVLETNSLQGLMLIKQMLPVFQKSIHKLSDLCKNYSDLQILEDISKIQTAFKKFSNLLSEAHKGNTTQTSLKEFWAHMRHDMRAAMGGVKGYAELILDSATDHDNDPDLKALLEDILKTVDTILPLIDQIRYEENIPEKTSYTEGALSCPIDPVIQMGTILIIDDNQEKHDLIKRRLAHTSYKTTSALSGSDAFKSISQSKPDLILLDLIMPGMSGFEVLNILKANPDTFNIPVLVISSMNETDNVVQCLQAGAEDYLPMPLNSTILVTRINSCMQKKTLRDREMGYINELNESRLLLEKAIQSIDEGFAIFDNSEKLIKWNKNFEITYDASEILKETLPSYEDFLRMNLTRGLYAFNNRRHVDDTDVSYVGDVEIWIRNKLKLFREEASTHLEVSGSGKWLEVITNRIPGGGTVCIHKDVTSRILQEIEITRQANHDSLTGLANRMFFEKELEKAFRKAALSHQSMAVMFFDLDGFKKINDTLGHDFGDLVLQSVGHSLMSSFRQDDLVARLGGDEFCAMIHNIGPKELEKLAQRCLTAVGDSVTREDQTATFGVSIGIALYPLHGQTPKEVIEKADNAMYQAKRNGKGCYAFAS